MKMNKKCKKQIKEYNKVISIWNKNNKIFIILNYLIKMKKNKRNLLRKNY